MKMERYVYLDGIFWDRVSNTAAECAISLNAKIERIQIIDEYEINVYLSSL